MWGQIKITLTELGDYSKTDADLERHAIHLEALGKNKSSKDLNNADLDKIFDAFDSILVIFKGPKTLDRTSTGPIKRLLWAIDQLGLDAPYIESIAKDNFGTTEWRSLDEKRLIRFRYTLTRASRNLIKARQIIKPNS